MRRSVRKALAGLVVVLAGAIGAAPDARADDPSGRAFAPPTLPTATLSADEEARLAHGQTVTREQTLEMGEAHYVGGVTYTLLDISTDDIDPLFDDAQAYKRCLPRTKDAKLVGRNGPDTFIELHQGNALVEAAYTIRLRKNPPLTDGGAREVRFWLDPTKPHAIRDAWGFFRYQPVTDASGASRVLLTYGILLDLGPGIVRDLFEERVRVAMLGVPQLVKGYVASRRVATRD
jgi:hypothetical protein